MLLAASSVAVRSFAISAAAEQDVALVRAMAAGDQGAPLTQFYERYGGRVMALLRRMLGAPAEAEELLQEVFLELWRRAPQYDPTRARVSTWVSTVARSRALDALRARKRRGGAHDEITDATAPDDQRPDEQAAAAQRGAKVRAALAQLSEPQRECLELAYFEGLTHREIAEKIDVPLGTVKSRIISSMKVLRDAMAGGES